MNFAREKQVKGIVVKNCWVKAYSMAHGPFICSVTSPLESMEKLPLIAVNFGAGPWVWILERCAVSGEWGMGRWRSQKWEVQQGFPSFPTTTAAPTRPSAVIHCWEKGPGSLEGLCSGQADKTPLRCTNKKKEATYLTLQRTWAELDEMKKRHL